jgi:hypothetical protein
MTVETSGMIRMRPHRGSQQQGGQCDQTGFHGDAPWEGGLPDQFGQYALNLT